MTGSVRTRVTIAVAALGVTAAIPFRATAQFAGRVDLHSGPVTWDQADGRDPLIIGEIGAGYRLRPILGLHPELLGALALSTGPDERTAFCWDFGGRLHTAGPASGIWVGAAIGGAGTGGPAQELTRLEGGVRRVVGPAQINVWLSRTGFGGRVAYEGNLSQDSAGPRDSLARKGFSDYTDLGSRVSLSLGRYELVASLTRRIGNEFSRRTGWALSGTWWVAPNIGVVGATGHSLPQFGLSLPGGRFGTVGLRLAVGARSPAAVTPPKTASRAAAPMLTLSGRRLTIRWTPAQRAEVMGDFTDWKPKALTAAGGGRWSLPMDLNPGVHHLNVRFDGGAWLVPSGALAVDDGFGGRVGLIMVK